MSFSSRSRFFDDCSVAARFKQGFETFAKTHLFKQEHDE
jgi:hypothetical protein